LGFSGNTELSILFTTENHIKELNRQYTNRDTPTDVLAFPMEGDIAGGHEILGDIVINTHAAIRQAKHLGHSVEREIYILIIHGLLHLVGYDDKTKDDRMIMSSKTEYLLQKIQRKVRSPG
jgi:probable rRNA maturation factor